MSFEKTVHIGQNIFCTIECEIKEDGVENLSITGVIRPRESGNSGGSSGQISDELREVLEIEDFAYAPGWSKKSLKRIH